MNKITIDNLSKLPDDCDLAPFVGFTLLDAVLTFREQFGVEAETVYTYTRKSGQVLHYVVVPGGAVPDGGVRM